MNTISDPKTRAQKIFQRDKFRQDFDQANTRLAILAMPLKNPVPTIVQLNNFVDAATELYKVCSQSASDKSPLDVLFWLRDRLLNERCSKEGEDKYVAECDRQIINIENDIHKTCEQLAPGKLFALLSDVRMEGYQLPPARRS